MHTKEARQDGETDERLDRVVVGERVNDFSEREKAALAWMEALTVLNGSADYAALRARLRQHFTDKEIVMRLLPTHHAARGRMFFEDGRLVPAERKLRATASPAGPVPIIATVLAVSGSSRSRTTSLPLPKRAAARFEKRIAPGSPNRSRPCRQTSLQGHEQTRPSTPGKTLSTRSMR
jgi:hypothetical protein